MIIIPGKPIAWKRPGQTKGGHRFDSQKKDKAGYGLLIRSQYKGDPLAGPVQLKVTFYMPIPDSWTVLKKFAMLGKPHVNVPDLDNMLKFVKDCMSGIVYVDDRQVWDTHPKKIYGEEPRTEIEVMGE